MSPKSLLYYACFVVTLFVGVFSFFYFTFNIYVQFAGSAGGIASATAIFLLLIRNLPSFQKNISPVLSSFNWIEKAELTSIAYNIQGNINQFRETVNKESPDLIPEAEVEWVTETNKESFFDDFKGKVIVRMDPSKDNQKNLAKAVMIQVSKGVLPESRIYIDETTSTSIDLALAKKILASIKQSNALRYFVSEILNPELADEQVLSTIQTIDEIDSRGFFTRLFLRELGGTSKQNWHQF
jgi:hypothetical protein